MHLSSLPPTLKFSFAIFILLHNSRQTPFLNLLLIGCDATTSQKNRSYVNLIFTILPAFSYVTSSSLSFIHLTYQCSLYEVSIINRLSFYTNYRTFNRIYILNFFENVHTISVRYGKFPQFTFEYFKK